MEEISQLPEYLLFKLSRTDHGHARNNTAVDAPVRDLEVPEVAQDGVVAVRRYDLVAVIHHLYGTAKLPHRHLTMMTGPTLHQTTAEEAAAAALTLATVAAESSRHTNEGSNHLSSPVKSQYGQPIQGYPAHHSPLT